MKENKLEETLFNYLAEIHTPFTMGDFFKGTALKRTQKNELEISDMIQSTEYFVLHKKKFYPRDSFLKPIPLRIAPTQLELERGILIPGHRIMPFHPFGVMIDDVTFQYKGKPIKTKVMAFKMAELQIYFSLMDMQKIPIHNIEAILDENADLEINVLDMHSFYQEHHFDMGDSIIVKSVNFLDGIFSIQYDSLDNFQDNVFHVQQIDRKFLESLKQIIQTKLVFPNVEKQLLYTYFNMRDESWTVPGTALGPLLHQNPDIIFSALPNGRTIFHLSDQDFEDLDAYPDFADYAGHENQENDFSSIDGILRYLDNNNDAVVVRALLLEMITQKKRYNYSTIEKYLFEDLPKPYMPKELRDLFQFLVREEFQFLKKSFNPSLAFLPITTARQKILEVLLQISIFLRSLDSQRVQLEKLPKNEMMHLMELDRALVEVLYHLEAAQLEEKIASQEVHRILKMVERMSSELPRMFDVILSKIK